MFVMKEVGNHNLKKKKKRIGFSRMAEALVFLAWQPMEGLICNSVVPDVQVK